MQKKATAPGSLPFTFLLALNSAGILLIVFTSKLLLLKLLYAKRLQKYILTCYVGI